MAGSPHRPLLDEMSWVEVAAAAEAGLPVVVPVGSTEQHGPHLPLGTDCVIPRAIALRVCESYPLVIAPLLPFGAKSRPLSGGGESFPGTISLRATTLLAVLEDVLAALARSGFRKICVQNWHYENGAFLWEACDAVAARYPEVTFLVVDQPLPELSRDEIDEIFRGDFRGWDVEHAAVTETSMMLAVRPDLVRDDLIRDDEAERNPGWEVIPPPADTIPASGVLWHASKSSVGAGHHLLERAAEHLRAALEETFGVA
jgi:creatinine amidohydrolase